MATTVFERPDSRSGSANSRELHYTVLGTASDITAIAAVAAAAPATHDGLPRRSADPIEVDPVSIDSDDEPRCRWDAVVYYQTAETQSPDVPDTGDNVTSFQIGGGSLHVSQAVKHIQHYEPAGIAGSGPDYKGAMNVVYRNGKPSVKGVDIPQLDGAQLVNLTRHIASTSFTENYRRTVSRLVLHVNNAAFTIIGVSQYAEGEVLFLGLDASQRAAGEDWEAQFRFAIRPNITDVIVNWPAAAKPSVAVPKKGWEYFWCAYKDSVGANVLVPRIRSINVDQVHYTADLTGLNP